MNETAIKPRRKHLDVPVHKPKKTYSANFSAKKHRHKCPDRVSEVIIEIPGDGKTMEKLSKENEEIRGKFNELEELSVKKIVKLKEKVANLQRENEDIRGHFVELQKCYEEMYLQYDNVNKQCAIIDKLKEDNVRLTRRNKEVNEDLNMLKTVVFRLNVQLERYQEKLRKHNLTIDKYSHLISQKSSAQLNEGQVINILSSDHGDHRHTPIAWGSVNGHTLGPLLDAYQDTINEKDDIIQSYEADLAKFTGRMKDVIEENENLYRKLTQDENCSDKLKGQLDVVRNELKLTKEQNDGLIKKCALKQDKIEEVLRVYENKVDQMKRDYQVVHEEYLKLRTENAGLNEKIKTINESQDEFKNERHNYIPIAVHTASVNECKKWYEELKHQYEQEKHKLKQAIDAHLRTINDLTDNVSKLEKDLKKLQSKNLDLEHTLNEIQLSRSACRKQLHKVMCFAKDMVAEQETLLRALNQRQLENRAVKKIGSEMAVRMDSLKTQLKDVQKSAWQEFSTVEQKIHEQADLIESMKEEHDKELQKLQLVIKEQEVKLNRTRDVGEVHSSYHLFREKYK